MNVITRIILRNKQSITRRIVLFYSRAKTLKYKHAYGWDDAVRDMTLAYNDMNLSPSNSTKDKWLRLGYDTAKNTREWGFAYKLKAVGRSGNDILCTMTIYDTDKCQNLKVPYSNRNRFILDSAAPTLSSWDMGYRMRAQEDVDGHLHLYKNQKEIPNCVFDTIIENFKERENGEISAIVVCNDKWYKIVNNDTRPQMLAMESFIRRIARRVISELRRRFGMKSLVG